VGNIFIPPHPNPLPQGGRGLSGEALLQGERGQLGLPSLDGRGLRGG